MENALATLFLNDQEDKIEEAQMSDPIDGEEPNFYLVGCFFTVSVIHVPAMWMHDIPPRFFSEVLTRQLGNFIRRFIEYDGESIARGIRSYMRIRLGHSDSFYEERMSLGFEVAEIGWYLSIRAQSKHALAMGSIWLRDDRKWSNRGSS
ncbi:hypothetical protein Goarm_003667, partial [Gossypium armourianum]|nr:hypothetical protein [Gossypium armourianum]